jgi:BASS family bile acid:Na+ symporter
VSISPLTLAATVALWASLLSLGAGSTRASLTAPLRQRGTLARIVAFDALVVPPLAWLAVTVLAVPPDFALGLLLVGMASAGPLGIVAVRIARADAALALAAVGILELANLVVIPAWSMILLPEAVTVPVAEIATTILLLLTLPLALGLLIAARLPRAVPGLTRVAAPVATGGWLVAVILAFASGWDLLGASVDAGVVWASLLLMIACIAGGWLVAGGPAVSRGVGALVTGQRGNAVSLGIATTVFAATPEAAIVVALCAAVVSLLVPATAVVLRWHAGGRSLARTASMPA